MIFQIATKKEENKMQEIMFLIILISLNAFTTLSAKVNGGIDLNYFDQSVDHFNATLAQTWKQV